MRPIKSVHVIEPGWKEDGVPADFVRGFGVANRVPDDVKTVRTPFFSENCAEPV
jgi:hypothetical protein